MDFLIFLRVFRKQTRKNIPKKHEHMHNTTITITTCMRARALFARPGPFPRLNEKLLDRPRLFRGSVLLRGGFHGAGPAGRNVLCKTDASNPLDFKRKLFSQISVIAAV